VQKYDIFLTLQSFLAKDFKNISTFFRAASLCFLFQTYILIAFARKNFVTIKATFQRTIHKRNFYAWLQSNLCNTVFV